MSGDAAPEGGSSLRETRSGVRAWLELARISNLPTCLSNVLVGMAIGRLTQGGDPAATGDVVREGTFPWGVFAGMSLAIALMYVAGMALNDAVDAPIDRTQRSGRPIPSGRVRRRSAFLFAFLALAAGVAMIGIAGRGALPWGLVLAAAIVLYDFLHKRLAASIVLMGVCRGLVYVASAAAVTARPDWMVLGVVAGVMTIFITLVTVVARSEHAALTPRSAWLHRGLPVLALLAWIVIPTEHPGRAVAIGLLVILWLGRSSFLLHADPPRPKDAVMGWLAGICLIDAYTLTLLDQRMLALIAVGLFVVTWWGHRRILGT